jgi:Holliday junction resolvase RusA-like endonuclease
LRVGTPVLGHRTPKQTRLFESSVGAYALAAARKAGVALFAGAVEVRIQIQHPARGVSEPRHKLGSAAQDAGLSKLPDLDNVAKAIVDGLQAAKAGIANDRQVASLIVRQLIVPEQTPEGVLVVVEELAGRPIPWA